VGAAVGGVGMYAASKDSMQGETDKSYEDLWDAAVRIAGIVGKIKKMDSTAGTIELDTIESSQIWIRVIRLTQATTRLRVSARRFKLPNLTLAQDVYLKIVNEVK
jgi:hypothetical protein